MLRRISFSSNPVRLEGLKIGDFTISLLQLNLHVFEVVHVQLRNVGDEVVIFQQTYYAFQ